MRIWRMPTVRCACRSELTEIVVSPDELAKAAGIECWMFTASHVIFQRHFREKPIS